MGAGIRHVAQVDLVDLAGGGDRHGDVQSLRTDAARERGIRELLPTLERDRGREPKGSYSRSILSCKKNGGGRTGVTFTAPSYEPGSVSSLRNPTAWRSI